MNIFIDMFVIFESTQYQFMTYLCINKSISLNDLGPLHSGIKYI